MDTNEELKVRRPDPRWVLVHDRTLDHLHGLQQRLEKESATMTINLQTLLKDLTKEIHTAYRKGWQDGFAVGASLEQPPEE